MKRVGTARTKLPNPLTYRSRAPVLPCSHARFALLAVFPTPPASYTWSMPIEGAQEPTYTLYRRGIELLEEGDFEHAAEPLAEAARREPEKTSVREALGRAYFRPGRGRVRRRRRVPPGRRLRPLLPRPRAQQDRPEAPRPPPPGAGLQPAP